MIGFERTHAHTLFELTLQNLAALVRLLAQAVSWTYWLLGVHRPRAGAALGVPAPARGVRALPQHDPARERDRARRLRADADRAAADVPGLRLRRHARTIAGSTTAAASSSSPSNPYAAMPSLHAADALIVGIVLAYSCRSAGGEGRLGALAGAGSGSGDGDRQPLLARHRRRRRRRARRARVVHRAALAIVRAPSASLTA